MKRQIKGILSLAVAICMSAVGVATVRAESLDLTREMTVKVTAEANVAARLADVDADKYGTICYDLYRIADVTDYAGFAFETLDAYSALDDEIRAAADILAEGEETVDWSEVAQDAAGVILGGEGSAVNALNPETTAGYASLKLGDTVSVEKGLYLLVARSSIEGATVVKSVAQADASGEGTTAETKLATYTLIDSYLYTFTPQLVCVPTTESKSSLTEDWVYAQEIVLKMTMAPATGSIVIDKTLTGYYDGAENATFVFQVDTYYPDETKLYASEVYGMTFTAAGSQSVTVNGLPIGATVKVSEVYSGVNYTRKVDTPEVITLTVAEGDAQHASFTNERTTNRSGGGGVTNYFVYQAQEDGSLGWSWVQRSDGNISTSNGLTDALLQEIMNLSAQSAAAAE